MEATRLYPAKAQYRPGETVELIVENPRGRYTLNVMQLEKTIWRGEWNNETDGDGRVIIGPFPEGGYGVTLDGPEGCARTAFDVASSAAAFPRYGFLSDFATKDAESDVDINFLLRCHVNLVQFYDWMYRHHQLVPPQRHFVDPMGRALDFQTVLEKVAACHAAGMKAMAYGAIYGAESEYGHPEQIMTCTDGSPMQLIGFINMMDFEAGGPWAGHIIAQFRDAMDKGGFDGIHLDQYGFPKFAYRGPIENGEVFDVEGAFAPFIRQVRRELPEALLIFNAVNNWPIRNVADAPVDAVYIEVWNPHDSYLSLQRIIEDAKYFSGGKPVILAAYLKPFCRTSKCGGAQRMATFELAQAAIYANGGSQLILGEEEGVLQDAYYCDHGFLPNPEAAVRYADFEVRYRDLLYDDALVSCAQSYCGPGNGDLYIEDVPVSCDARPGTVWFVVKKKPGQKILHLINLLNQTDSVWNAEKKPIQPLRDLKVVLLCEKIRSAFVASPENPELAPVKVEPITNYAGSVCRLHIPEMKAWSMLVINH